ncbi:MAG: ribosomal RNA small subunit methyltransferase A [Candidatus Binatia bacterium]|nr:MAG: ribosomal RNA small subunit methyltransferase A [Candidatus Binatia bacterium]
MPLPIYHCEHEPEHTARASALPEPHGFPPRAVLGARNIREALKEIGRGPRKDLGQHFLAQPCIAERMAKLAGVEGHHVVEIGPGLGVLTQFLLGARRLWLVEVDPLLARRLEDLLGSHAHVTVQRADALALDWPDFLAANGPVRVVGNLPYNIATPLIETWLGLPELVDSIVVMVQHEVGERLRARPGTRAYGALSVLTQAVARVRKGFSVAPGAFVPPPKVRSQVVVLEPDPSLRARVNDWGWFQRVVRTVFAQRRKQIRNSLLQLTADPEAALHRLALDPTIRPENLSVDDFLRLSAVLSAHAGATRG